jgi:lysine 2,3-aminomutase
MKHVKGLRLFHDISEIDWNDWRWQLQHQLYAEEILSIEGMPRGIPFSLFDKDFGLTPHLVSLIEPGLLQDPIALQFFPREEEDTLDCMSDDPFNERGSQPLPGLIRRYPDRVIILAANGCASYCRYCTRRWNWHTKSPQSLDMESIAGYLAQRPQIREVIVSGGDPLLLEDNKLAEIFETLKKISSVEIIRIGSRLLTVLPQRFTSGLISTLAGSAPVYLMTHFNHPVELTPAAVQAIGRLVDRGIVLCNQSVLLKDINDNIETLTELNRSLVRNRIRPYYLFHCDPVSGTSHFVVPKTTGRALVRQLRDRVSGLCVPTYVEDVPGPGKLPID